MKAKEKFLKKFFVVLVDGRILEVKFTDVKTSVKIIYDFSKGKIGHELFPQANFVGITMNNGLYKFQPHDGKRCPLEGDWIGICHHTKAIVGLFFKKEPAIKYCIEEHDYYPARQKLWPDESRDVLRKIGDEHPVFIISEEISPKREDGSF